MKSNNQQKQESEFYVLLCACYNVTPPNLQSNCSGCGISFDVRHTLCCCKEGLVIARHNEASEKILYLDRRAFTSAAVRAEPLIHQVHTISQREIRQCSGKDKETPGDMMIQGLWGRQAVSIIDIKIDDSVSDSYIFDTMATVLTCW